MIARFPEGYRTVLGRWFEHGTQISGGEWQRIALARAFMRDAPILVLDEPTAALDARGEYEIFRRFRELTRDRIVLLISHRFSTVRMADRIYVLDCGHIVESGDHEQLIRRGGHYAELFQLQAAGYQL
jgi:ATP-binding cassette subfamily B protein